MDEDWLDQDTSDDHRIQGSTADPLVLQHFERISTRYADAGYREGITEGKLSALQNGFDQAFASSVSSSRRLGQLRGRAFSILALLKLTGSGSQQVPSESIILEGSTRDLATQLNRVRWTDILPPDLEAEAHAKQEHGEEGPSGAVTAATGEVQDQRALESLEAVLDSLGGINEQGGRNGQQMTGDKLREEALLDWLEANLKALEAVLWGP